MISHDFHLRHQKVLSVIVFIIALVIFYALIIFPAIFLRDRFSEKVNNLQFQYAGFLRMENQRDKITGILQKLKNSKVESSGFLNENSPALAAAELQAYIKKLVDSGNGTLNSTQVVNNNVTGVFPQVTIRVKMRCYIQCLMETVYSIESGDPVLLMDNVFIQGNNSRISGTARVGKAGAVVEQPLDIRFDVTGFIYKDNLQ